MKLESVFKQLLVPGILILTILSCQKHMNSGNRNNEPSNYLGILGYREILDINQAVHIYDSTKVDDSIEFFHPPTDAFYEWHVNPNNGCDSIIGNPNQAIVNFAFHCAGKFNISATIFDSLTRKEIGHTDTIEIVVTPDTLYPWQPLNPTDKLLVFPGSVSIGNPVQAIELFLNMYTKESYEFGASSSLEAIYHSDSGNHTYSAVFTDRILLPNYPFVYGNEQKSWVRGGMELEGLPVGVTANLNITWQGFTYQGTIKWINTSRRELNWNNSGGVIIQY